MRVPRCAAARPRQNARNRPAVSNDLSPAEDIPFEIRLRDFSDDDAFAQEYIDGNRDRLRLRMHDHADRRRYVEVNGMERLIEPRGEKRRTEFAGNAADGDDLERNFRAEPREQFDARKHADGDLDALLAGGIQIRRGESDRLAREQVDALHIRLHAQYAVFAVARDRYELIVIDIVPLHRLQNRIVDSLGRRRADGRLA